MSSLHRFLFFNLAYLGNPPWETGISPPELIAFLESHSAGRALDLGCGSGTNVITLCRYGWDASGVDFIPLGILRAKRKAAQAGLARQAHFYVDSVARLKDIRGRFDLILDMGCYHGLLAADRASYRQKLTEHLADKGNVLIYGMLRGDKADHGIDAGDITAIARIAPLQKRVDGTDRQRASTWLWFSR